MLIFLSCTIPSPRAVALTLENIDTLSLPLCRNLEPDKPEGEKSPVYGSVVRGPTLV